jgi:hypothetical protein
MKTCRSVFVGMVAVIALCFGFVGCDDGNGGNGDLDLSGNINIDYTGIYIYPYASTELTAAYSGNEVVTYQWNKDGTAIDGETAQKFTLTEDGYYTGYYTVTVNATGYNSKTSEAIVVKIVKPREDNTVTVYFTALSDTTPTWWDTLESVLKNRAPGFDTGIFTLTVTPESTDGFTVVDDGKKTTVGEKFLETSDYDTMRSSLTTSKVGSWLPNRKDLTGTLSVSPSDMVQIGTEMTAYYNGDEPVTLLWFIITPSGGTNSYPSYRNKAFTPDEVGNYFVQAYLDGYYNKYAYFTVFE